MQAHSATDFLNSMGAVSSVSRRGETLDGTINAIKYTGLRWLRVGYEDNAPMEDFIETHYQTGITFSYGLLSGGSNIQRLVSEAKQLASANALLAIEGANEPNNWGVTYQGEFGGQNESWLAVAKLHRDLYSTVKSTPELKGFPVWATCETGAQTDNAGLQFLKIPEGANTIMPAGTIFADYANCHNYVTHPSWQGLHDNQTWLSADPGPNCPVDGLYGNFGKTWRKKFDGYSVEELQNLPRVTTETGYAITPKDGVTEEIQAKLYLNLYLSQFKRGWKHTAIYLLKGRANEPAHETYAFYKLDYTPKQAAHYLHNFTSILNDNKQVENPGKIAYTIKDEQGNQPETTHDLLLQKSDGTYLLVLWGEKFGSQTTDEITVDFGKKYKSINIYNPTKGKNAVETLKNTQSVNLSLSNHPFILELAN